MRQFQKSTILLDGVKLLYQKEFPNYTKAEKDIHTLLKDYRCKNNREFFKGDLQHFINTIDSLNTEDYQIANERKDKEIQIELNERILLYLLQEQVARLDHRIDMLEEKERSNFECLMGIVDILKGLVKRIFK